MVGIVQSDRNRRVTQGPAVLRTREDHILHRAPSELFDPLLSKHPAHCVCHIALAASVRADDPRNAIVEIKFYLICKGFESLHFYTL